jgi:hypothetical protein
MFQTTLLKYLPLDAAACYAFTAICQYVVSAFGVIIAFNYIGINLDNRLITITELHVAIFSSAATIFSDHPKSPVIVVPLMKIDCWGAPALTAIYQSAPSPSVKLQANMTKSRI